MQKIIPVLFLVLMMTSCIPSDSAGSADPVDTTDIADTPAGTDPIIPPVSGAQIIADHTVVARYSEIPQKYIDIVKGYLVELPGNRIQAGTG